MELNTKEIREVPHLCRVEITSNEEIMGMATDLTHTVYAHETLYKDFCPVHTYVNCPPEKVFDYMSNVHSLEEWTYSLRGLFPCEEDPDLYKGKDHVIGDDTDIYCRVVSNKEALQVDYHCAWDQGKTLWMIYLNRIVPAEFVLGKPGSVIFWQNCRHPFYDNNPFPETAPTDRDVWIGDLWDLFYAGHTIEITNLKKILEYRHANNKEMGPFISRDVQ